MKEEPNWPPTSEIISEDSALTPIYRRGGAAASPRRLRLHSKEMSSPAAQKGLAPVFYGVSFICLVLGAIIGVNAFFETKTVDQFPSTDMVSVRSSALSEQHLLKLSQADLQGLDFYWEEGFPSDQEILFEAPQQSVSTKPSSVTVAPLTEKNSLRSPIPLHKPADKLPKFTASYQINIPTWQRNAVPTFVTSKPQIAIVIDDLGFHSDRLQRLNKLPGPMTFAFLPYAQNANEQIDQSRKSGHEIMVHMPMQPMSKLHDPGPDFLSVEMSQEELAQKLRENLSKLHGYVGINNHMGSRLTSDSKSMSVVMDVLKEQGLLYLDSRTIAQSVGFEKAKEKGIPVTQRDVFIDHVHTVEKIEQALKKTEKIARENGAAIAIGHPSSLTVAALEKWLPTLEDKGFQLVPISALTVDPAVKLVADMQ